VTTDQSTLLTAVAHDKFTDDLIYKIWNNFRPHSFVVRRQTQDLTQCKETLNERKCAVLVDIAENYSFVAHDAVQGYLWSSD
jgi:hypothetical protein